MVKSFISFRSMLYIVQSWSTAKWLPVPSKIPSEIEVALRYMLLTPLTLFTLQYTVHIVQKKTSLFLQDGFPYPCYTTYKQLIYLSNRCIILSFFATGRPTRFRAMNQKFTSDWLCRELAGLLLLTRGLIFQQILLHQKETNAAKKANPI